MTRTFSPASDATLLSTDTASTVVTRRSAFTALSDASTSATAPPEQEIARAPASEMILRSAASSSAPADTRYGAVRRPESTRSGSRFSTTTFVTVPVAGFTSAAEPKNLTNLPCRDIFCPL